MPALLLDFSIILMTTIVATLLNDRFHLGGYIEDEVPRD